MRAYVSPVLQALAARKRLILAVTLLAFAAAAVREAFTRVPHEAEVILVASSFGGGEQLGKVMPESYSPKTYGNLAMSVTVVGNTLGRLSEADLWKGDAPGLNNFMGMLQAEVTVVDETTRPINFSPLIILRVTAPDEVLARQIADTWADETMRAARQANDLRIGVVSRALKSEQGDYRTTLHTLWEKQAQEEAQWNVDVLRTRLDEKAKQILALETESVTAQADLAATQQRVMSGNEALGQRERFLTLFRSPSDIVFWLEEGNRTPEQLSELMKKGMVDMEPDPVYAELQKALDRDTTMAAGLEAQVKALQAQLDRLNTEREQLQAQLAEHSNTQRQLQTEILSVKTLYDEVAALEGFTGAAARIASGETVDGRQMESLGLSRLSPETYCVEKPFFLLGRKGRVLMITFLGFLLASAYAVARESGPTLRDLFVRRLAAAQ